MGPTARTCLALAGGLLLVALVRWSAADVADEFCALHEGKLVQLAWWPDPVCVDVVRRVAKPEE